MHHHWVQFYTPTQRIWQSPLVIINPRIENGAGVWMTSCLEEMVLRIWGFWKDVSWDWTIEARVGYLTIESWILTVERCSWVFRISTNWDLKHHQMHCVLGWGQHSMVSKDLRIVCLMAPWTEARSQTCSYLKWQNQPVFVYVNYTTHVFILSALTWKPMPTAAHSRLCSRVSVRACVSARRAMSFM